jgi:hypothetical protein
MIKYCNLLFILFLLILGLLILGLLYINRHNINIPKYDFFENENKNKKVSLIEYQNLISNDNNHSKIYKPKIELKNLKYEDCERQCGNSDCLKMREKKKILDKCFKCQNEEGKCFKKSITGGSCDDCGEDSKKIDCLRTDNFGCTNPANFNDFNGSYPYYFELQDYDVNSPFDQKCVFCWQIQDEI